MTYSLIITTVVFLMVVSNVRAQEVVNRTNTDGRKEGKWIVHDSLFYTLEEGEYHNGVRQGLWIEYHPFNNIKSKGSYRNGKKNGTWRYYDDTERLIGEGTYADDVKEGIWLDTVDELPAKGLYMHGVKEGPWNFYDYYDRYKVQEGGMYADDERTGHWIEYSHNGEKELEGDYRNNLKDGVWTHYSYDGKRDREGTYRLGMKEGVWTTWEDSVIISECHYTNGKKNGCYTRYGFRNNNVIVTGEYKDDKKNGVWQYYNKNGKLNYTMVYDNGLTEGKQKGYGSEGRKLFEREYLRGKLQGKYLTWSATDGSPEIIGAFVNGVPDGHWVRYAVYPIKKTVEYTYDMGKLNGEWLERKENGDTILLRHYVNDTLNGLWIEWYDNHQRKLEKNYLAGLLDGETTEWYQNGKERLRGRYDHDEQTGFWTADYESGVKDYEGGYDHGRKQGLWTEWYYNGNKASECEYQNWKDGKSVEWYSNGMKKSEGRYYNGNEEGAWMYWYYQGTKEAEGTYTKGVKRGTWTSYHTNGVKRSEGDCVVGRRNGPWIFWFQNGKEQMEGMFVDDKRIGTWKFFDLEGELVVTRTYQSGLLVPGSDVWNNQELENLKAKAIYINWYDNGNIEFEGGLSKGIPSAHYRSLELPLYDEEIIQRYSNSAVSIACFYKDGCARISITPMSRLKQNHCLVWYSDGKVKIDGSYTEGKRNGHWIVYDPSGEVGNEGDYVVDNAEGVQHVWYWYHHVKNGRRCDEPYEDGVMNGRSVEWDTQGQKQAEGEYVNGKREGVWLRYYDGKVFKDLYEHGMYKNRIQ